MNIADIKAKAYKVISELKNIENHIGTVYRWASKNWLPELKIWWILSDKWLLSSSKQKLVADRFAKDYLFEIKSKTGKDISKYSSMKSEDEVLFLPNSEFKIVDIKWKNIKLEEISTHKLKTIVEPKTNFVKSMNKQKN